MRAGSPEDECSRCGHPRSMHGRRGYGGCRHGRGGGLDAAVWAAVACVTAKVPQAEQQSIVNKAFEAKPCTCKRFAHRPVNEEPGTGGRDV